MQPRPDPRDVVLPPIPAKRYFTIGEVSELCAVKPHVLRYWEQEFTQLRPMKRRGNRRYYQHHEVLLVRRIRELLYGQGFTISGARNRLAEGGHRSRAAPGAAPPVGMPDDPAEAFGSEPGGASTLPVVPVGHAAAWSVEEGSSAAPLPLLAVDARTLAQVRVELMGALELLRGLV